MDVPREPWRAFPFLSVPSRTVESPGRKQAFLVDVCLDLAGQSGDTMREGTFDGLRFYRLNGKYYVRMKSSFDGKRFLED
jgi:hypothetical protein